MKYSKGYRYINITWKPPLDNGSSSIIEYKIYRDKSLYDTVYASQLWYNDTNVSLGESYTYYVTAVSSAGEGEKSESLIIELDVITPTSPRNLKGFGGNGYVNLTWKPPLKEDVMNIKGYNIYRDGVLISSVSATQLWYNDTNVTNNKYYSYYITAVNSSGESFRSNMVHVVPTYDIWASFHHDFLHTGRSYYDTSNNIGKLVWRFNTDKAVSSSPAIGSDGTIYVGSSGKYLYALYPNGTLKWKYQTWYFGVVVSSPTIGNDGTIYVGSGNGYEMGYLSALYPNGTLKWKYQTGDYVISSPVIGNDGTIYFGSEDGYFYALYPNGTLKWKHHLEAYSIESSPAIGNDGTVYITTDLGFTGGYLYAIYPNGTIKWKYFASGLFVDSSPAIGSGGTIYFGSCNGYLYAIYPNGTLKWKYLMGDMVQSSPAIGNDGTIYVGSDDQYLYAINPDGTLKWRYYTDGSIWSSPAIGDDGTIYVGSNDGYIYAIYPSGTLKWRYHTEGYVSSSPAIGSDGTIYVGSDDGYLYAIGKPHYSPLPPNNLKVKVGDGYVNLTWEAPNSGIEVTGYRIYRNGTLIATVPATQLWYNDTSVGNEVRCVYYYVTAVNGAGESGKSNIVSIIWIHNIYELQNMSEDLGAYYVLANDIDGSLTKGWNGGAGFIPIGNYTNPFEGTFDGQGHVIRNLWINRSSQDYVGLFGNISSNAVVENVGLINATVRGRNWVGGLVGKNGGVVINSYVTGSLSATGYNSGVGGLVGESDGKVSNSYAAGSVSGGGNVGGLVGWNKGAVSNSYATGSLSGCCFMGGLIGKNEGIVTNSYAMGNLSGSGSVGGLVGGNWGSVHNSYATGNVAGSNYVGGLVGLNYGTVKYTYSTGKVDGSSNVGGLIGYDGGTVIASFWDVNTSGQSSSAGGVGKTTIEMKNKTTFTSAGWDFNKIWNIYDGKTYPFLRWQKPGKPSEPLYFNFTVGNDYVNLTWTNPSFDGAMPITEYRIYRNGTLLAIVPASQLWYNDTDVESGVTYTYYVTAVNSVGESPRSNEVQAIPGGEVPEFGSSVIMLVTIFAVLGIATWRKRGK